MGKRVSISQPTVIQTELRPLSESFWIDANGQLEQWYYQNTGVFSPDRQITALRLSPKLSLLDLDTNASYSSEASQEATTPPLHVSIQNVVWTVKEWNGSTWVETNISSVTAGDPYHTEGNDLIVSKNNYDAAHAINIKCRCNYADPRDIGTTCWLETTLMLVTNMDATQVYPTIDIKNPSARMFNPLKDDPIYEFEAEANWDVLEGQGGTDITEYKVDALGTEKILPANEDMLVNAAPLLDIKYGDTELAQQQFMDRQVSGGAVSDIPDGLAKIDNIKGDTVKIVQLLKPSTSSQTVNNVTKTYNNDGSFTLNGISSDVSSASSVITLGNATRVVGHKYYYRGIKGASSSTYKMLMYGNPSASIFEAGLIQTYSSYDANKSFMFWVNGANVSINNLRVYPIVLDLTAMGIDSLTTAAQVEEWLATHIGNLDYIPYTGGKLVNYGGYSVKLNQRIKDPIGGTANSITASNCSVTYTNGVSIITGGSGSSMGFVLQRGGNAAVIGHIYYCVVVSKATINADVYLSSGSGSFGRISKSDSFKKSTFRSYNQYASGTEGFGFYFTNVTEQWNFHLKYAYCIDLTAMFGAGNEPDLAWCDKYLSRDYYDYCAGIDKNILDVAEVKTAGFNKWDEEWELGGLNYYDGTKNDSFQSIRSKNFMKVTPNSTIYVKAPTKTMMIYGYDKDYNHIGTYNNGVFNKTSATWCSGLSIVLPANMEYIKFGSGTTYGTTYNHDICINISDPSRNGTYEPYKAQFEKLPMGIETKFNQFSHNSKDVIPYDAIPVEYIENTQGAYIETDLVPNSDDYVFETKMYLDGYYTDDSWCAWFLAYSGEDVNAYRIIRFQNENNKIFVCNHVKARSGTAVDIQGVGNMYTVRLTPTRLELNGVTTQLSGAVGDANTGALNILHRNTHLRVYYFKVYKSGTLIMDLIPVRVGSVGYLYDKVSGNLYGNSGTGSLLCGNDLPHWESFSDMSWITKIGIENFNIWDEEAIHGTVNSSDGSLIRGLYNRIVSVNFQPCEPNTEYYVGFVGNSYSSFIRVAWYNASYQFISVSGQGTITSPSSARYFRFTTEGNDYGTTYKNDICFNKSIPAYNGKYLPHGQTMPYFPNGLCNVGNVYDEVKVENGKIKGVVRFKMVALNTWKWTAEGTSTSDVYRWSSANHADVKRPSNTVTAFLGICTKYATKGSVETYTKKEGISMEPDADIVRIYDSTYNTSSDKDAFVSSLTGVYLVYELATPYEFEIDYPTKGQFEWYGIDGSGNEVPIDTLPVYSQAEQPSGYGQHSSRIRINALYGENIPVILRVKRYPWDNVVLPPKITKSVAWKMPPLDVIVTSNKGSAVRSEHLTTPTNFTFSAIVNQQGEVISDEKKQENLVFKWYYVKWDVNGNPTTSADPIIGMEANISTEILKNSTPLQQGAVKQSTNVYCEVYLLGAYHLVNGTYVRTIE